MNLFDDILDFFIALVIIFIFPLLYFGLKEDTLLQTVVSIKTEEFVSDIKSDGYLTRGRYDQYLDDLAQTGLLYEVSLVHRHKLLEPEYKLRTEEEVAEALEADFNGTNDYTFHSVTSVAPVVSDPVNTGTLNTETNASVMNAAVNTATSPSHVHTDACYSGINILTYLRLHIIMCMMVVVNPLLATQEHGQFVATVVQDTRIIGIWLTGMLQRELLSVQILEILIAPIVEAVIGRTPSTTKVLAILVDMIKILMVMVGRIIQIIRRPMPFLAILIHNNQVRKTPMLMGAGPIIPINMLLVGVGVSRMDGLIMQV